MTNRVILVRKWADTNTDALLESKTETFSIPSVDGLIGYRIEAKNAIVYGDPVCAPKDKGILAKAFQDKCSKQNLGVVYTIVSESFAKWGVQELNGSSIEFGKRFILNPLNHSFHQTGEKASLARRKMRHALKEGATVFEYTEEDLKVKKQMEEAAENWKQTRHGFQVHFSNFHLFENRLGKRWFYAKYNDSVVGFLVLNQLQAYQGWLLNHVMMTKEAPHGTTELLVITALQTLEKENCHFVLAGPIPSRQLGKMEGLNLFTKLFAKGVYKAAQILLNLDRHQSFWEKFQPQEEGSYLLFPQKNLNVSSISSLLKAYNTELK